MRKTQFIFFLFNFLFISQIFPHGDLEERIHKVTEEIEVSPDSAYLYVKRGKLYFQHEDYKQSIDDLNKSKSLGYQSVEQKILFAKGYNHLNEYKNALSFCEQILCDDPRNVIAIQVKARTYLLQNNFSNAALEFEKVIKYSNQSFPENYIDASYAWESFNNEEGYKNATIIIQKGIENLGHLISLSNRLIELEVKRNHYDSAIETQLDVIKLSPRKETAYFKLSKLYSLKRNKNKALESLIMAKEHFNDLPERLKNTAFMKELIENIKSKETLLISN